MGETNAFFYERPSKFFLVKKLLCPKKNCLGVEFDLVTKFRLLGMYPENFSLWEAKFTEIYAFKVDVILDFCDFCDFLFVFKHFLHEKSIITFSKNC